jgi:hypothetical protein
VRRRVEDPIEPAGQEQHGPLTTESEHAGWRDDFVDPTRVGEGRHDAAVVEVPARAFAKKRVSKLLFVRPRVDPRKNTPRGDAHAPEQRHLEQLETMIVERIQSQLVGWGPVADGTPDPAYRSSRVVLPATELLFAVATQQMLSDASLDLRRFLQSRGHGESTMLRVVELLIEKLWKDVRVLELGSNTAKTAGRVDSRMSTVHFESSAARLI